MKNRIVLSLATLSTLVILACFAGCMPQQTTQTSSPKESSTETPIAWSIDTDCSPCHTAEATSTTGTEACLAKAHADLGNKCADCHEDTSALADVHANAGDATPASALKKTEVTAQTCLSCHESLDVLAQKTADVAIVDDVGNSANPHALQSSKDHDAIACADCHVSHKASDALSEAKSVCLSCHHAGVFECGTCHM